MPARKTKEEVEKILDLHKSGSSQNQIHKLLGFDRTLIRQIIKDPDSYFEKCSVNFDLNLINKKSYSFILGVYLGDGCISRTHKENLYRLRISLDQKYKNLNTEIIENLNILFPNNKVSLTNTKSSNGCVISVYSSNLLELFPQHDTGLKHDRPIILKEWQKQIVDNHLMDFLKGLFYTDGSFYFSRNYERCNFTNKSKDIINLCSDALKKLEINHCVSMKNANTKYFAYLIQIQKKEDMAKIPFRKT